MYGTPMKHILIVLFVMFVPYRMLAQGGVLTSDDYDEEVRRAEQFQFSEEYASLMIIPLEAYPDAFSALSDFNFSFVRYNRRGYDYRYRNFSIDGVSLYDPMTGNQQWNLMGAIYNSYGPVESETGLAPGSWSLGGLGDTRAYSRMAGTVPKRISVGMMFTDRRFRGGVRAGISSGWMKGGWAIAGAGSRRWGRDQHIRGVYMDDWTVYASIAKKLGKKHILSAAFLLAPSDRGVRGAATQEAFELTGDPLYNPYWGYQDGRIRSSRTRKSQQPMALLAWDYKRDEDFKIHTVFSYLGGESSYSALDWFSVSNPTPDYYRYMPGYQANPEVANAVEQAWRQRDPNVTQINWNELYYVNQHGTASPASYVVGSAVTANRSFQLNSSFDWRMDNASYLRGGIQLRNDRVSRYQRLEDLIGGDYLLDVDPYLIDDEYYGDQAINDLQHPNRRVGVGERYGYNYDLDYSSYGAWALADLHSEQNLGLYGYVGGQVAQVSFSRIGRYEKELFPGSLSLGPSEKLNFTEYMLKGGIGYAFTPAHSLEMRVAYGDVAPVADALFLAPEYQNRTVADPRPINLLAGELEYRISWRSVDIGLCGYVTTTRGEGDVRHYYDDLAGEYANMELSGIDKLYAGVELGVTVRITDRWSVRGAGGWSRNLYLSDPAVSIYADHDNRPIVEGSTAYMKGYRLGNTPQVVASGELRYSGARMWTAAVSVNYVGSNYIDISPVRRMRRVMDYATSPEALAQMTAQERFGDATTINLFVSKTFRIKSSYLTLSGSVNNLANRRHIVYSGYEPLRMVRTGSGLDRTVAPMASRYYHAYPRTYYLTINFRF